MVKEDTDYHALYEYFRNKGNKIDNVYIIIDDTPVQFLPSFISPLFEEAVTKAKKFTFKNIPAKVVSVEHLIGLLLVSYRPKDKIRILDLITQADRQVLDDILTRFENEKTPLRKRLEAVLGNIQ